MHEGHRNRLRERLLSEKERDTLNEHEILELLLFYIIPRKNTNPIAHALLKAFGSLANVFDAEVDKLMQVEGIGRSAATFINMIPAFFREYAKSKNNIVNAILTSENVGEYVKALFYGRIYEVFYLISLDSSNRVINTDIICHGSIDSVEINLRNIINTVLRTNASSVILAHNHPGGSPMPSQSDKEITKTIQHALSYINIKLLDHIVVSGEEYISMAFDLHII
ncbi:MAG: DNA repair protein RadC [Clostridia bacterium]|nr:DNA repair protein RadC [Clostridia bacterium]